MTYAEQAERRRIKRATSTNRVVIRDGVDVITHMRQDSFIAANAAFLAITMKDDEGAAHWYSRACATGITFA